MSSNKDRRVQRQGAAVTILAAYWDGWHAAFPALHRRGHWHIAHHLCTEAPSGAPLGELLGLTRQALLLDDATMRDRIEELVADGLCRTDPHQATLSARTIVAPTPSLSAGHDASLLSLRHALANAAPTLHPGAALSPAHILEPADRILALHALAVLTAAWSSLLDRLCDARGLSQARRVEVRRHLLSTSHRTLLVLAIARYYAGIPTTGILADRMAAILLERTGQNFQTTRDHIATLITFGLLERRPGRSLSVGLAAAALPAVEAAMATLADRLTSLMQSVEALPAGAYALRVSTAGESPRVVRIDSSPFTIGRTEGNTLRLAASDISRQHCQIEIHGAEAVISDLGSTNGTELNGRHITGATKLQDGAVISLGPFQITFLAPSESGDATVRQRRGGTLKVVPQA